MEKSEIKKLVYDLLVYILYGLSFVGIIDIIARVITHGSVKPIQMVLQALFP